MVKKFLFQTNVDDIVTFNENPLELKLIRYSGTFALCFGKKKS